MKKLAVVLAVVVIGFVNAQDVYDIEQYKKECNCDSATAVGIYNVFAETSNWVNNTHTFKTGDNDKAATIGILKDIFTDPNAKFKYAKINPIIAQLQVNGFSFGDTISYSKWIESIPVYDTSKYEIKYINDNADDLLESISVVDKITGEWVRSILIYYNQRNFRLITDSSIGHSIR
jgi:hypothetical protein